MISALTIAPRAPVLLQPPTAIGNGDANLVALKTGVVLKISGFEPSLPLQLVPVFALVS